MCMFLLEARLVIVFFAFEVSQIQLVYQAAFLKQFERPIDRNAIELGILLFGHLIETLGVQMQARVVDQLKQQTALARETHTPFAQRILYAGAGHGF